VTVKLNAAAVKRLARKHHLNAAAVAVAHGSSGRGKRSTAQLVLQR
jgi:hypothetical protein